MNAEGYWLDEAQTTNEMKENKRVLSAKKKSVAYSILHSDVKSIALSVSTKGSTLMTL